MNPNLHVCYAIESESKIIHKMDISVNTREVKDTKYEEPAVMDIKVIKAPGYLNCLSVVKSYLTIWI